MLALIQVEELNLGGIMLAFLRPCQIRSVRYVLAGYLLYAFEGRPMLVSTTTGIVWLAMFLCFGTPQFYPRTADGEGWEFGPSDWLVIWLTSFVVAIKKRPACAGRPIDCSACLAGDRLSPAQRQPGNLFLLSRTLVCGNLP
jgi:hypothetical protein